MKCARPPGHILPSDFEGTPHSTPHSRRQAIRGRLDCFADCRSTTGALARNTVCLRQGQIRLFAQ